jgi:hypothetical protein
MDFAEINSGMFEPSQFEGEVMCNDVDAIEEVEHVDAATEHVDNENALAAAI